MPLLNNPKFKKDREDLTGRSWSQEDVRALRPEALAHLRDAFDMLETGLLADGREWILGTERPSLADIEGWQPFLSPFHPQFSCVGSFIVRGLYR